MMTIAIYSYIATLTDACQKYVDVHEQLMCDWSIPFEQYGRLL
jgi:hypothetical protein